MGALFECQDCDFRTLSVRSAERHENTTPHEVFETDQEDAR